MAYILRHRIRTLILLRPVHPSLSLTEILTGLIWSCCKVHGPKRWSSKTDRQEDGITYLLLLLVVVVVVGWTRAGGHTEPLSG
jgi:hypothetical protein